ncbi:3-hydroxybutyryl-CoA dehydrogenase [Geodermatophilus sp. TF02-6]|uniref:3-hydroxyacyl-CoA dehydrogenase family protein n=1 Tax=Geodermatophilus sp. TF02-6 TaxID=2250575 RepID=UPI000DEB326F|nr:3-hydroxyacyl-CoA dehydrogenase family protein [Geodermatophilus sp. TF02-6]RBY79902.1 3-hydroxybutyryl-CoA dehydrogenase [Geodermatophilus sp. TF02-6]
MASNVGVIGGGTMGIGIAYVFAVAGATTTVVEPDDARMATLRAEVEQAAAGGVARGKLAAETAAALRERIGHVTSAEQLPGGLDLVVETVPESRELKRSVLVAAESRGPAVLASNTSALSIDDLASALAAPERFLGLHFFNPVWSIPVVEVVRGAATSDETLEAALSAVAGIGKQTAVVRDVPGFATSRLDVVAALEAIRMVESGVGEPAEIDRAIQLAYRHPVGPLRLSDIVGLDVRLHIARNLERALGPQFTPPQLLIEKVEAGELGRKTGRGFYDWDRSA